MSKKPEPKTAYKPLVVDGKRDKARRYVAPDGSVISRREHIKRTEGTTPERKALKRYVEGKTTGGKTVEQIIRRQEKRKTDTGFAVGFDTPVREMYQNRNAYQLTGRYFFINRKWDLRALAIGYSTVSNRKKTGEDYLILREQAVNSAQATLPHSGWEYRGIDYEKWLHW